jgi:hypothetical protein
MVDALGWVMLSDYHRSDQLQLIDIVVQTKPQVVGPYYQVTLKCMRVGSPFGRHEFPHQTCLHAVLLLL